MRTVSMLLVFALVASGCGASESGDDRADVVARLAEAGIAVFQDPGDSEPVLPLSEPVSPVTLVGWQAEILGQQGLPYGGLTATELDDVVAPGTAGEFTITPSGLIEGWAREFDTPAAEWARELLSGPSEWTELPSAEKPVYSSLVMLLFASDIAAAASQLDEEPGEAGSSEPASGDDLVVVAAPEHLTHLTADARRAPCSSAVNFVNNVVAKVFDALGKVTSPPPVNTGLFGGVFDRIVNAAIGLAAGAANIVIEGGRIIVNNVVQATVGEIMGVVARIAGVVSTIATVKSLVEPWTVRVTPDPPENRLGIAPGEGLAGTFVVEVSVVLDEWPAPVADCARVANVTLPDLKPSGRPVAWEFSGSLVSVEAGTGVAVRTDAEAALSGDAMATLTYVTTVEEPPGPNAVERTGYASAKATVTRDDDDRLQELFLELLADGIRSAPGVGLVPGVADLISAQARQLVQPVLTEVTSALSKLREREEQNFVPITFHEDDEEETRPEGGKPEGEKPEAQRGSIPGGCPDASVIAGAAGGGSTTITGGLDNLSGVDTWILEGRDNLRGETKSGGTAENRISGHFDDFGIEGFACTYAKWTGPARPVDGWRPWNAIVLWITEEQPPEPGADDRQVQVAGSSRAWFSSTALHVDVDQRLVIIYPSPCCEDRDWESVAPRLAERVLGVQ